MRINTMIFKTFKALLCGMTLALAAANVVFELLALRVLRPQQ